MKRESPKLVIFDFDGVISNTFEICYDIHKRMASKEIDTELYKQLYEGNINHQVEKKDYLNLRLDDSFFTEYTIRLLKNPVVGNMPISIKDLASNYTLAIISSSRSSSIRQYLAKHGIEDCFSEIWGRDVDHSKVEKINNLMTKYKADPQHCVFVTDTLGDIEEASKAGIDSIAVSWGLHSVDTLKRGNPKIIIDDEKTLIDFVNLHFITRYH